jgi:hypothetical protein
VQDKNGREKFVQAYEKAHSLDKSVDGQVTLDIGDDKWPFPFPAPAEGTGVVFRCD